MGQSLGLPDNLGKITARRRSEGQRWAGSRKRALERTGRPAAPGIINSTLSNIVAQSAVLEAKQLLAPPQLR